MNEYCFNNEFHLNKLLISNNYTIKEIEKIQNIALDYKQDLYYIPILIPIVPTPYKPIRLNFKTKTFYVPNKNKLIKIIKESIYRQFNEIKYNNIFPIFFPVSLYTALYIETPSNFSKVDKYLAEVKILRPDIKPDNDNMEKIIFDSIKETILYDDAQVVSNVTEKFYSITPRIEIILTYNKNIISKNQKNRYNNRIKKWLEKGVRYAN